ncbi:hypothetical protein SOVF_050310 isoform B [Spinacia oleracea]|uniref:Uncharacterized protein At4g26450 isoform X2 n=1 Tax=Spinacia oleracea TaxID=3562 RepID=A0A9R0HQG0_SPIOL|nr:uncharacterized protein At4g26450 isoform X2 [Spinacia oleracea]KNA20669.1 hypothetical protein SOVF_050310 isoform B [Spinacia oleracea]
MRSNMTGIGFYNSEPRNFNRGFGRGIPKPFQPSQRHPSPQPSRKGDLFIEAGKLAVEYLVSRGLLSSNVLPGKYQNGSLRNNSGEPHDLRSSLDRDSNRRSSLDLDITMSRSYSREKRRLGPSRSFSSDWSRENEKEGSLTEEAIPARTMEVDNDTFHKDTTKDADTFVQNSHPVEPAAKDDSHTELEDDIAKGCSLGDLDSAMTSLVKNEDDKEVMKVSDSVNTMFEESKTSNENHDMEKDTAVDNLAIQLGEEKSTASPLINNHPDSNPTLISNEIKVTETGHDSLDSQKYDTMNNSEEILNSKGLGTDVSDHSFSEAGGLSPVYPVDQQGFMDSLPFTDKTFSFEQKSSGLPVLGMCNSISKDRGEKRPIEEDNMMEGVKKAKHQWLSVAQSDEYSHLSDLSDKHSVSPEKGAMNIFNVSASQDSFTNVSLDLKGGVEANLNQGEKQLLSNSFKICDLNLMEASDMHENHEIPALLYPTIPGPRRDLPVDIDLSVNNSCNLTNDFNDSGSMRKDIEIIDLESTSLEGCKSPNTSLKNNEAGITSMESFQNPQNSTENPDGQDGYGFMISELLGNDVPNCSSVQPDMNSLHNGMGLNHGEGMFSEDDPIYMSLGEIPLSLLRDWEQPTQERNPFEL